VAGADVFVGTAVVGATVGVAVGAAVGPSVGGGFVLVGLGTVPVARTSGVGEGGMIWVGLKTAVIVRFGVGKTKGVGVIEAGKLQADTPRTRSKAPKRILKALRFIDLLRKTIP
jgi:hypothetical protein